MKKYTKSMQEIIAELEVPDNFHLSSPAKISLKPDNAFSLPAGPEFSCPGATTACEDCYAKRGRHNFRAVQKSFARNWLLLNKFAEANDLCGAANLIVGKLRKDAKIFRINESGDMESQFVIDVWDNVIGQRESILFWAYTRSFDFDYEKILNNKNFALWASTDDYNLNAANLFVAKYFKQGVKHAYGPWDKNRKLPERSFFCPVTTKVLKMEGACEKCKLCVVRNRVSKHVTFLKH